MSRTVRIAALGDSLTAGHVSSGFWPDYAPYTDVLTRRLGPTVQVENYGVDGDLTSGMLERLRLEVLPRNPDLIILVGGANDLGWGMGQDEILRNLTEMMEGSLSAGATVVVGSVPPIAGFPSLTETRRELNRRLEQLSTERGAHFTDLFGPLSDDEGSLRPEYSSDGLHMTEEGYAVMGEVLCDMVEEVLARHGS
jgi:lysophospholipase L1-like esterase